MTTQLSDLYYSYQYIQYPELKKNLSKLLKNEEVNIEITPSFFQKKTVSKNYFKRQLQTLIDHIQVIWMRLYLLFNKQFKKKFKTSVKKIQKIYKNHLKNIEKKKAALILESKKQQAKACELKIPVLKQKIEKLEKSLKESQNFLQVNEKHIQDKGEVLGQFLQQGLDQDAENIKKELSNLSNQFNTASLKIQNLKTALKKSEEKLLKTSTTLKNLQSELGIISKVKQNPKIQKNQLNTCEIKTTIQEFFSSKNRSNMALCSFGGTLLQLPAKEIEPLTLKVSTLFKNPEKVQSWSCTKDGHFIVTLTPSLTSQEKTIEGHLKEPHFATFAFLATLESCVHKEIKQIIQELIKRVGTISHIQSWQCDSSGRFELTMSKKVKMWTPAYEESHIEKPGGITLLLGDKYNNTIKVIGYLQKNKISYNSGFNIYTIVPKLGFKNLRIFNLKIKNKNQIITEIGLIIPIIGKKTIKHFSSPNQLKECWGERSELIIEEDHTIFQKNKYHQSVS